MTTPLQPHLASTQDGTPARVKSYPTMCRKYYPASYHHRQRLADKMEVAPQ